MSGNMIGFAGINVNLSYAKHQSDETEKRYDTEDIIPDNRIYELMFALDALISTDIYSSSCTPSANMAAALSVSIAFNLIFFRSYIMTLYCSA